MAIELGQKVPIKALVAAGLGAAGGLASVGATHAQTTEEVDRFTLAKETAISISAELPGPTGLSLLDIRTAERRRQRRALEDRVAEIDSRVGLQTDGADPVAEVLAMDLSQLFRKPSLVEPETRRQLELVARRLERAREEALRSLEIGSPGLRVPKLALFEEKKGPDPIVVLGVDGWRRIQKAAIDALEGGRSSFGLEVALDPGQRRRFRESTFRRQAPPIEPRHDHDPERHLRKAGFYKDRNGVWKERDTPLEKLGKVFAVHFLESLVDAILYPLWPERDVRDERGQVVGKEVEPSYRWTQKGLELLGYAWLAKHAGVAPTIGALIDHLGFVQDWMFYGHHWWMKQSGLVDALVPENRRSKFDTHNLLPNMSQIYDGWWSWTLPLGDEHLRAKLGDGRVYGNMLVGTSGRALNITWGLLQLDATPLGDQDLRLGVSKKSALYRPAQGLEWLINGFAKLAPF